MSARRALLVANPTATTTTPQARALIEAAFSPFVALTVAYTEGRGHGMELARAAMRDGVDVVLALGGDGTVNEVVNGLLADTDPAAPGDPATRPLLGVIPGGFANVVARALGLSADPLQAAAQVLHALRHDSIRELSIAHLQWQPAAGAPPDVAWVLPSDGRLIGRIKLVVEQGKIRVQKDALTLRQPVAIHIAQQVRQYGRTAFEAVGGNALILPAGIGIKLIAEGVAIAIDNRLTLDQRRLCWLCDVFLGVG